MKNNKGITMITLVITIVLLMILAGVSLNESLEVISDVRENKQTTELQILQHAILERYTKYKITENEELLIGTKMSYSEVLDIIDQINTQKTTEETITLKQNNYDGDENIKLENKYFKLQPSQLELLDIEKATDTYIVNYKTGEVINYTQLISNKGTPLYTYSIDNMN